MKSIKLILILLSGISVLAGCAHIKETSKVIWGSSTSALEEARDHAISAEFSCDVYGCFNEVLNIAAEKDLKVFIKDRSKDLIVLMGIPESINTTEVGVFFTDTGSGNTKIDISSLSISTKMTAADIIFPEVEKSFPKAN